MDRMSKQDLMDTMTASVVEKLTMWFEILGSKEAAIAKVKEQSCAGAKAWENAFAKLGW